MAELPGLRKARVGAAALVLGAAALIACAIAAADTRAKAAAPAGCPRSGAKVLVTALGNVTLNGAVVPVDNLATLLSALAPRPTEVCYFREKPKGEPPAAVRIAVNAIIAAKLPITFYSDASFTTRVGMPSH